MTAALRRALTAAQASRLCNGEAAVFSTAGRQRYLTDAMVRRVLEWQRNRKPLVQVARENGVTPGTIYAVIRRTGAYKRRPPDTSSGAE